jgi:hypothetical protein
MKQLYPRLPLRAYAGLAMLTFLLTGNTITFSQTALNFNAPTLASGTSQLAGSVYRFSSVTLDGSMDALVSVDSLIGVSLSSIDATPSGSSTTAFQPQLSSDGTKGYHYGVFTITFVSAGTTNPQAIFDFSSVFMGLDGSNQILEFNSITIANASWQYVSDTPKVAVTQNGDTYSGTATSSNPDGGQGINETDSSQMFKVSTPVTTSFTVRVGYYQDQKGWNGNDLFSLNFYTPQVAPIILPVNLLSFNAGLVNDKVSVSWSTSHEENVSHYIIERSYDKNNYDEAALIFAAEAPKPVNNYSYKDAIKNTAASVIYYRLKMVDKDGKYKYSEVRTIRLEKAGESAKITAYPNPVVNDLRIKIPSGWQNKAVKCEVLNTNGQIIKSFTIPQGSAIATIALNHVPAGTYYVRGSSGKEISIQPIIVSGTY